MKLKLLVLMLTLTLAFCSHSDQPGLMRLFGAKTFWTTTFVNGLPSKPKMVPAVFLGSSSNANIYLEVGFDADNTLTDTILNQFETRIAAKQHRVFSNPTDINGDGKVTFLILDIDDGAKVGEPFIAGYFDPLNEFNDNQVYREICENPSIPYCSRSNEQEILYLDIVQAKTDINTFMSTLAHEYQHLLHFTQDMKTGNKLEEKWVNEGLSEVASDITGYGPQSGRLRAFRQVRGNSLTSFKNKLIDYSHSYVYFRFLTDIYGEAILTESFQSLKFGVDGINIALQKMNDPDFLSKCGSNLDPLYPYFDCSMRYMWADLYNIQQPKGSRGTSTNSTNFFTKNPKYSFVSGNRPHLPVKEHANHVNLAAKAVGVHLKSAEDPQLSANCFDAPCTLSSFTLFYDENSSSDTNTIIVYNHTARSNHQIRIEQNSHSGGSLKSEAQQNKIMHANMKSHEDLAKLLFIDSDFSK